MTENEIRDFDEMTTSLLRTLPGLMWSFYSSLKKEGFTSEEALELTKAYLIRE